MRSRRPTVRKKRRYAAVAILIASGAWVRAEDPPAALVAVLVTTAFLLAASAPQGR